MVGGRGRHVVGQGVEGTHARDLVQLLWVCKYLKFSLGSERKCVCECLCPIVQIWLRIVCDVCLRVL